MVTWARLALTNRPKEGEKSAYPQDYRGHWDNNREIYVFNTHYFNGPDAALSKLNASRLILKRINALNRFGEWEAERPLFLMGDFNCRPGTPPYRILVGDKNSTDPDLLKNTFEDVNKIDWILYKGNVNVLKYEEVTYNVNGVYPSDHKPIYVEVELPGK
jgi:endonuclease/exonuclease/phosphatase family metal-dependent hydrolase